MDPIGSLSGASGCSADEDQAGEGAKRSDPFMACLMQDVQAREDEAWVRAVIAGRHHSARLYCHNTAPWKAPRSFGDSRGDSGFRSMAQHRRDGGSAGAIPPKRSCGCQPTAASRPSPRSAGLTPILWRNSVARACSSSRWQHGAPARHRGVIRSARLITSAIVLSSFRCVAGLVAARRQDPPAPVPGTPALRAHGQARQADPMGDRAVAFPGTAGQNHPMRQAA